MTSCQDLLNPAFREDPVILVETGHTYERANIEHWLATHNICPSSNIRVTNKGMVPNWAIKTALAEWQTRPQSFSSQPGPASSLQQYSQSNSSQQVSKPAQTLNMTLDIKSYLDSQLYIHI